MYVCIALPLRSSFHIILQVFLQSGYDACSCLLWLLIDTSLYYSKYVHKVNSDSVCACMCVCVCARACACVLCECMHVYAYKHARVCMLVCVRICVCVYMFVGAVLMIRIEICQVAHYFICYIMTSH